MSHTCTKCSRVNPDEAVYCYFDGVPLNGRGRAGGPVSIGSQPFANPFVFPSGRTCRSFDELAMACQQDWDTAKDLLREGFFGTFFGGLGRADLARAAADAQHFPDLDRALDRLLVRLPSSVLDAPRLRVDPPSINLGTLHVGDDRAVALRLENQGMRLLFGEVASDCNWLALGDGPGTARKSFQVCQEAVIPVKVVGKNLRAHNHPLSGKLLVESNGGPPVVVQVRADVPVKPFPGRGVFAGALSPREAAERARTRPREAADLFEKGEVAAWYRSNGWTYPVQGPAASGLGAVQQFFEALGLTAPPRVEIGTKAVTFTGDAKQNNLRHVVELHTDEKRPVYAHATSDQPWLEVGRAKLNGRVAQLTLTVPSVPERPGETLTASVKIQCNGNQRFVVPVTLHVTRGAGAAPPPEDEEPIIAELAEPPAEPAPVAAEVPAPRRAPGTVRWAHAVPAALLGLALLAVVVVDLVRGRVVPPEEPESMAALYAALREGRPLLSVEFNDDARFGITMRDTPDPTNPKQNKRLTWGLRGESNNTRVKIDGRDPLFGDTKVQGNNWVGARLRTVVRGRAWRSTMRFGESRVDVTQNVMLVPSQSGDLDTCLVFYTIKNNSDSTPRKVALRVLLDTFIGSNDGVPFTVPGQKGFVTTSREFKGEGAPDYLEAVENPDNPNDPGTVARVGLRGIRLPEFGLLEAPERVVLCRYPGGEFRNPSMGWDWKPYDPIGGMGTPDSCVAVYWEEKDLEPGEVRHVGYTYGLGTLAAGEGSLALSVPSTVYTGSDFFVTAYVYKARRGQKVSIELPEGLALAAGEGAEKTVEEDAARTTVSWKVRAGADKGDFPVKARSDRAASRPAKVVVKGKSIFG